MSVFFITFVFTFVTWQLLTLFRPDWTHPVEQPQLDQKPPEEAVAAQNGSKATDDLSSTAKPGQSIRRPPATAQLLIYVAILSSVGVGCLWFLSYLIFHVVHAPLGLSLRVSDAILGRHAAALVMGTIAGCLASMSFNRVFYQSPSYALTSRDKLIFAALGFFVVLGMGGEDLIHSFASRINKVAIGGAEVTFTDGSGKLGSTADPNNATAPLLSSGSGNDQKVDPLGLNMSKVGLFLLTNLPQIIERDIKYIGFISSKPNQKNVNVNDQIKRLRDAENIALLISAPISAVDLF